MKNYEVTFIVDPVLSSDEIKTAANTYSDMLKDEGCKITHIDEMGLKQLAYPIKRRNSGVYYSIEYGTEAPAVIAKMELAFRRDERIMRFLTIALDKYGVQYNQDKRDGKIGVSRKAKEGSDKPAAEKKEVKKQDLGKIEGIGPKISEVLASSGILTYADLAAASQDKLKEALAKGGDAFKMHDPTTWTAQAKLADQGKWNELQKMQDELNGGVAKASEEE
jgi:small subunit ribosomal protein S6